MISKRDSYIIKAFNRGYKVSKNGKVYNPKGDVVKGTVTKEGYLKFGIRFQDINSGTIKVHRLQAYQKFGNEIFLEGIQVRHLNNIKLDNSWDNIDIGTQSENKLDMPKKQRQEIAEHASSFIKIHDHERIKEYYKNKNVSYNDIMEKFDISSKGTVSYIINK